MPIYPIPDIGERFEDANPKLLTVVFKFKTMVDSLYSHFNSPSFLDLNSYRVRCLKKILKMMETYCFIISTPKDLCSANIMTRCIVDNTAAFLLIYNNDDNEVVLLRHYLAILDSLEARDKALKDTDIEHTEFKSEEIKKAVVNMNSFTSERAKSAKQKCLEKIRELHLYETKAEQLEALINKRNWRFKTLDETGSCMKWREMYSFQDKVAPAETTEYLSQDVHGLAFSVENIEAESKAFVGGIEQVGYCCQLLGTFICERLKHLNTPEVISAREEILKEAQEKIKARFPVITLCGSTRFKEQFLEAQKRLTLEGNIVISVGLFGHSGDDEVWTEGTKEMLDDMHKRKIDMADAIYVINVGGYIGESTRSEIEYAMNNGKEVMYLEALEEGKVQNADTDLVRVRAFIDTHEWHFAKTMPEIPHWYCLLKDKGDVEEFRWFAAYIREHSVTGQFYGKTYYYFRLDGYKYWWMDPTVEECDLINRDEDRMYEAPDGLLYASYQAYCNDPDLDLDLVQTKLASGTRIPQNDFEKKILQDIIEARKEGKYLEIYPN